MTNEREALAAELEERARIRRQISTRKSVQEGKPDRIADLLERAARMLRQTTMAGPQESRVSDDALRGAGPSPAGPAPESPAGVADMERLYGVYVPDYRTSDSSAAPELSAEQERRQGHSALRVRDGQIERFDPHPSAAPEGGLSVEQIEVMCAMLTKQGYAGAKLRDMALRSLERPDGRVVPEELTFAAFRAANVARCIKWHPAGIASWSPSDWLTAVTGELGELASLLKMRNRERDGLPGNKFSPTNKQIADEIADVLTYLDLLAEVLGVNLGHAAAEKFNEISERVGFPDRIVLSASPPAATEGALLDACSKSRLFSMFLRQGFWHAHHVDLVWRYNGKDVREEADWLKDVWYLCKERSGHAEPRPATAAAGDAGLDKRNSPEAAQDSSIPADTNASTGEREGASVTTLTALDAERKGAADER